MTELLSWPFPLLDRFLEQLGYFCTVEAFESASQRRYIADLLRQQGIETPDVMPPTGLRRYVMLCWEPSGDELAFADGVHSGTGQLNHWVWLDYFHEITEPDAPLIPSASSRESQPRGKIARWFAEHHVDLGSSDDSARHALVVDTASNEAYVAPIALAHRIVRSQSLEPAGKCWCGGEDGEHDADSHAAEGVW